MALGKRHSISTFITKFLWILFLVFQESKLVISDVVEDDSLKKALEAVERRQRDLEFQDNEYYGQPENIGYGFQKTLGFFESGPATELGSFDSSPKNDNDLQNLLLNYGGLGKGEGDYEGGYDKRKSNFRERMSSNRGRNSLLDRREGNEYYSQTGGEYLQLLKNLWSKYRDSRSDEVNVEDLTDEQVEEILSWLQGRGDYPEEKSEGNGYETFEVIPVRSRKNYRVFDGFSDRRKRYPSFGEGIYGKRNLLPQNYGTPQQNDFLYSLKFVNPELNREAVEGLREEGFELLGDEKDRDVMRMLNDAMLRGKYMGGEEEDEEGEEQGYWPKDGGFEEEDTWLSGPVSFSDEVYDALGRNEKRGEPSPRVFKNHNGVHLKRGPVKRSPVRVRKEAKKTSKEVSGIFATPEVSTELPKKPTEIVKKKQNLTKPEVTKLHEGKKVVVRRAEKLTKEEEVAPVRGNEEILDIFGVDKKKKKSIDWSQYFGLDKRTGERWLKEDYLRRAEGHLTDPKWKRYPLQNYLSGSQYEMPFDTRKFNEKKRRGHDAGSSIDKMENKIGDMEEKIIDDAVKYTGAHTGGGKEDMRGVKTKVIQHLEAAYNLEKMKNALEEFKNLIKPRVEGGNSKKPATEVPKTEVRTTVPKESPNLEKPMSDKIPVGKETRKRTSRKKEGVQGIFSEDPSDGVEFLNELYERKEPENEGCPVLEKILHNCLRVEEMGGRYAELLLPLCSLQQICYFCGGEIGFSKMSMCDAMYLTEAQNICQGDSDCLINARNSMVALQDLYEQDFGNESNRRLLSSGSCLSNPCIQRYFLSAPGAIYPLEIQK